VLQFPVAFDQFNMSLLNESIIGKPVMQMFFIPQAILMLYILGFYKDYLEYLSKQRICMLLM